MLAATDTIRNIVLNQPSSAAVLERFDIDLCAHAQHPLDKVCGELQLSLDQVLEKLASAEHPDRFSTYPVPDAPCTQWMQYIVRAHHQYVRRELPQLKALAQQVAAKHGSSAPNLVLLKGCVETLYGEMLAHLDKEENILFPYIAHLEERAAGFDTGSRPCFRSVQQPIRVMMQEHDHAEDALNQARELTAGYQITAQTCAKQAALLGGLKLFEQDLREHIHLEDDILFPKAVALEAAVEKGVRQ